jgi:hypothetical protein
LPRLSRYFIRTALIYLIAALATGIVLMVSAPWGSLLWPTYVHLLVVGWLTQLIFGVTFWLFPRYSAAAPRGSERLGWASYWMLNAGLLLRVIGEPTRSLGAWTGWLLVIAAVLQLVGGWAFVLNTWPRIKER